MLKFDLTEEIAERIIDEKGGRFTIDVSIFPFNSLDTNECLYNLRKFRRTIIS